MEIWKDVKEYEGLYQVSNLGNIRSLDRKVSDKNGSRTRLMKGRLLQNICSSVGYHMVALHKNEKRQARRTVHRIVMETFFPKDDYTGWIVDHINGNKTDNRLENLRWANFHTNNRNTPYIRYLQKLLQDNNIEYIKEDVFES